jgi:hypothetical protein
MALPFAAAAAAVAVSDLLLSLLLPLLSQNTPS